MNTSSVGIRHERLADGVRYILPRRQLREARTFGFALIGVGPVVTAFMMFWIAGAFGGWADAQGPGRWLGLALVLVGMAALTPGLVPLAVGLAIVTNVLRAEVELRGGQLRAIERFGPLRWTRKRPTGPIDRLAITGPCGEPACRLPAPRRGDMRTDPAPELASITARGEYVKPMVIAPGYPRSVLEPLADELAAGLGAEPPAKRVEGGKPDVGLLDQSAGDDELPAKAIPVQPPASRAVLERRGRNLTLTVPPPGLPSLNKRLPMYCLIWNGSAAVLTAIVVLSLLSADEFNWWLVLFLAPFWILGIGLLIGTARMGRRWTILDVVGNTLLISKGGPSGAKQRELRAAEIAAIHPGASSAKVGNIPVLELHIHLHHGERCSLLFRRNKDELEWIAAVLRNALGANE